MSGSLKGRYGYKRLFAELKIEYALFSDSCVTSKHCFDSPRYLSGPLRWQAFDISWFLIRLHKVVEYWRGNVLMPPDYT